MPGSGARLFHSPITQIANGADGHDSQGLGHYALNRTPGEQSTSPACDANGNRFHL
jgi:hypothetical protein